jgi:hypothetical protein
MKSSRTLRFLAAGAVTAVLVACGGGGGGGGGGGTTTPTAPTPPTNTGLAAPSLVLNQSAGDAYNLVTEMVLTYTLAEQAQAANALGALVPGVGSAVSTPYSCTTGTIDVTDTNGLLAYSYNNCSDGVYSYNGTGSQVVVTLSSGAVTSYELTISQLAATGPGSLSTTLDGTVTCTPAAMAGQKPQCVTTLGGYIWGYDISYSGSLANGSHQCNCGNGSWNVTFKNFGPTSGTAEVFASNASAIVTRTGAKTFTVVMFVGSDVKTYTVTLP